MFDDILRESVADDAAGFVHEGDVEFDGVVVVVAGVLKFLVGEDGTACGAEEEGEGVELHFEVCGEVGGDLCGELCGLWIDLALMIW